MISPAMFDEFLGEYYAKLIPFLKRKGVKNVFFGGEGLFHTRITGPGKVYIQSMPIIGTARALTPYLNIGDNNGGGNGINIRFGE